MGNINKLTRYEAERLLQVEKTVTVPINWELHKQGLRLQVKVYSPEYPIGLRLVGFIGKTNYSFSLLYQNYPIRKYTKHDTHTIGGIQYHRPHKHIWDGVNENNEAYIPSDINPDDDINKQFLDFCKECTITILSNYQSIDYQIKR